MNETDAKRIVLRLLAAWPMASFNEVSEIVWVEFVKELHDARAAAVAVDGLIRQEERMPSIARLRTQYNATVRLLRAGHELEEAPTSAIDTERNVGLMHALRDHIIGGDGHTGGFDVCEHTDCVKARERWEYGETETSASKPASR